MKRISIEKLDRWRPIGAYITSGAGEDNKPDCQLVLYLRRWVVYVSLPQLYQPETRKVVPDWYAATIARIARLGRDYCIQYTRRDYGFMFSGEGLVNVYLGRQTRDSSTEQRWGWFMPWTQWRFVRHSFYGLEGEHLWTQFEKDQKPGFAHHDDTYKAKAQIPTRIFAFTDFDGEAIEASTLIEEREWHFGTGWFKWLSFFRAPRIRRSLDITFTKETGPRKGSWKGGTIGHGIDMLPNELHEAAFRRYCTEHNMTFKGSAPYWLGERSVGAQGAAGPEVQAWKDQ